MATPWRQPVVGRQRVRATVADAEHRRFDGHAREVRAELHGGAGGQVLRLLQHRLVVGGQILPRRPRAHPRERVRFRADERLDGVGDGVDARHGRDRRRLRDGQFGVEDAHAERGLLVPARHLHVAGPVGDEGVALGLAAGAAGGRHAHARQHRLRRLVVPAVVGHLPAVRQQEVDPLRTVHRRPAADGHDQIDGMFLRRRHAVSNFVLGRVLLHPVKHEHVHARRPEHLRRPLRVADVVQTWVGDEQRATAERPGGFTQLGKRPGPEDHPAERLEVKRRQAGWEQG